MTHRYANAHYRGCISAVAGELVMLIKQAHRQPIERDILYNEIKDLS